MGFLLCSIGTVISEGDQSQIGAWKPLHAAVRRLHCHRFGLTICSLLLEESASSCANGNIPNHRRRAKTEQEERSIEFPFGASLIGGSC